MSELKLSIENSSWYKWQSSVTYFS